MKHLSEQEFYEALDQPIDTLSLEAFAGHLAGCVQCRAEMNAVRGSVESLRGAASGLARSEFRPLLALTRTKSFGAARLTWPLALAAAGVVCAASVTMVHRPAANDAVRVQAVSKTTPAEADDALLDGINQDLSTPVPPSLAPLEVSSGENTAGAVKQD